MKRNTLIISIILIILALAYFAIAKQKNIQVVNPAPQATSTYATTTSTSGKMVTGTPEQTFSGSITAVDTGCFFDATCSVSVDGKKVILVTGGRSMDQNIPVGKLIGVESIGDLEKMIGAHANVYAGVTAEGNHTLYGNSQYYVEVIRK